MPGLIACRRRWGIGSDDFVFPAVIEIITRLFWLTVISVVFNVHQDSFDCKSGDAVRIYYIGTLVILVAQVITSIIMAYNSMQGSVIQVHKRRHLAKLLYMKWTLFFLELVWTAYGTYWAFSDSTDCKEYIVITVKVAVLSAWGVLGLLLIGLLLVFDTRGTHSAQQSSAKSLWETRCKLLCCCAMCDDQSSNAFTDVAEILTGFFEDMDIVATDVVAALILLRDEQHQAPQPLLKESLRSLNHAQPLSASGDGTDHGGTSRRAGVHGDKPYPRPAGWMTINEAAYYMKFAMGSYGWPLYMFMNLGTGCCKLMQDCRGCLCMNDSGDNIVSNDNCCECNTSAIYKQTGIDEEDLVYATFHNRIYEIPFYVALDHHNYAIVVSIRGTLSLRDALTDMTAECEYLELPGQRGEDLAAHKGIVLAAKNIYNKLIDNRLLDAAYERGQGYKLVITGHSLGAGAAAILAVLLKPRYPSLICFSYSPPGGLMSKSLAEYTQDFVCSIVVGEDLIPRLSLCSLEDLKTSMLRVVRDSPHPKYKILATGIWSILCNVLRDEERINNSERASNGAHSHLLDRSSRAPTPSYTEEVEGPVRNIEEAIASSKRRKQCLTALHLPGHILYLEDTTVRSRCCGPRTYEAMWAKSDAFSDIIVSQSMLTHHMPDVVYKALTQLASCTYTPRHLLTRQLSNDSTAAHGDNLLTV